MRNWRAYSINKMEDELQSLERRVDELERRAEPQPTLAVRPNSDKAQAAIDYPSGGRC